MAFSYKQAFMAYMEQQGVKYRDKDEFVVTVTYTGDNLKTIPIYVFFDKDGDGLVQLACWEICNFSEDKQAAGLICCNQLNSKYRWVKFYVDSDRDTRAEMDAIIDPQTVGAECLSLVRRMVNIVDEAYPTLMAARFA